MRKETNKIEQKVLIKLQLLSEKISDLIYNGKFDEIVRYDNERKKIIKSFTRKTSNETLEILKSISKKNKSDILSLEKRRDQLSKNYNLSIKTFNAYSK